MKTTQSTSRKCPLAATIIALATILIAGGSLAQTEPGTNDLATSETRTVLITGANRGIGLEMARQYSDAGWRVIGTARNPDSARELKNLGAAVLQLDVTDQASVDRLSRELGDQPIDMLMNNAGILPTMRTLAEVDIDDFNRAMAVNAIGPVRVTRAVMPNLRAGDLKQIVNTTSILGSIAENTSGGFYGYRESKAALNMFTRSLAAELGREGFVCIVVHPGWVRTDMGGASAPTTAQESVLGIRSVIEGLSPSDNGTFWTFDGKQLAW